MAQWYILYNGQQVGPMDQSQLLSYGLNPQSQVWKEGMPQWAPAYTIPELMSLIQPNAAPGSGTPPYAPVGKTSEKDKTACGVLAILLGGFGVQYFYLGKIGGGFLTILLTIVTCGLWSVLTLVQGILMLTMSDAEFERKFVYSTSTLPLF